MKLQPSNNTAAPEEPQSYYQLRQDAFRELAFSERDWRTEFGLEVSAIDHSATPMERLGDVIDLTGLSESLLEEELPNENAMMLKALEMGKLLGRIDLHMELQGLARADADRARRFNEPAA